MTTENVARTFEETVLLHLDAAYNLARWLTRNADDAEEVVHEACMRARRLLEGFRGRDSRTWLLTIVRDTCHTWLKQNRRLKIGVALDEKSSEAQDSFLNAPASRVREANRQPFMQALEELPIPFREVLVLRELENLSYNQIADVTGVPLDAVMSNLFRARERLRQALTVVDNTLRREDRVVEQAQP